MQINTIGFPTGLLGMGGAAAPAAGIGFAQLLGAPAAAATGAAPPPAANDALAPPASLSMAQLLTTAAPQATATAATVDPDAQILPVAGASVDALPAAPKAAEAPVPNTPLATTPEADTKPAPGARLAPSEPAIEAGPATAETVEVPAEPPIEAKAPVKRHPKLADAAEDQPEAAPATPPEAAPVAGMVAVVQQAPARPEIVARPQASPTRKIGEAALGTRTAPAEAHGTEPAAANEKFQRAASAIAGKSGQPGDDAPSDDKGEAPAFAPRADSPAPTPASHAAAEPARVQATPGTAGAEPVVAARPGHLGQQLGIEIARKVEAGDDIVRVRLSPDNLGKVEVTLSFDDGGTLRATVRAESQQALDLLRQDVPDLGRALDQAGIRADTQSFRFESRGDGGGGAQAQHQQQSQNNSGGKFAAGDEPDATETAYRAIRGDGQVDLLA